MKLLVLGLSVTSSWGNGHATTYRSLLKALAGRGHAITFVEWDAPWYQQHRDLPAPEFCELRLYSDWNAVADEVIAEARQADAIVIGSYFPDAIAATERLRDAGVGPLLFYDIDTPITIAALRTQAKTEYLRADLVPSFATYMSFTGGPLLGEIEEHFGSPRAVPLFCSVDTEEHRPMPYDADYGALLSYLGTYAADRQEKILELLDAPARAMPGERFIVAGPMYPEETVWAENLIHMDHVPPPAHAAFYSSCRFTLNLTRQSMVEVGWSPSVRLFEAAACGAAMVSDWWPGIESFFTPGEEILLASSTEEIIELLRWTSVAEARAMGRRARERVLREHTAEHRAEEFEAIVAEARGRSGGG